MNTPIPPNFNRLKFSVEGLAVVAPRTHRLAKRSTLELEELKGEPIIAGDARWERYTDMVNELCNSRGFSLEISQRAYLRDEMLSLVLGGMGVLIYPNCIMNAARFGLRAISISDVGDVIMTSLIWRDGSANLIVPPFIEAVRKSLGNAFDT